MHADIRQLGLFRVLRIYQLRIRKNGFFGRIRGVLFGDKIWASRGDRSQNLGHDFLAMPCLIINLLIYIIAGIVCSAGAAAIFHMLAHIVINFFVVPLIGTLLGAVLAIYAKRGVAYIVLLVITFFSSPAVNGFCADLYYSTGISANRWLRVFPFMTPSSFFIHLISLTVIHLDRIDYLLFNVDIGALCVASFLLRTKPLW